MIKAGPTPWKFKIYVTAKHMRCLVKNVAMFGLGISVFAGMSDDTLPDAEKDKQPKGKKEDVVEKGDEVPQFIEKKIKSA